MSVVLVSVQVDEPPAVPLPAVPLPAVPLPAVPLPAVPLPPAGLPVPAVVLPPAAEAPAAPPLLRALSLLLELQPPVTANAAVAAATVQTPTSLTERILDISSTSDELLPISRKPCRYHISRELPALVLCDLSRMAKRVLATRHLKISQRSHVAARSGRLLIATSQLH
jgi:hypothetical protein